MGRRLRFRAPVRRRLHVPLEHQVEPLSREDADRPLQRRRLHQHRRIRRCRPITATLQQYNFTYAEKVNSFATDNRFDAEVRIPASVTHKLLAGIDYRNVSNKPLMLSSSPASIDAFDPVYDPAFAEPDARLSQRLQQPEAEADRHLRPGPDEHRPALRHASAAARTG